jgi:hypothetical protein
MPDLASLAERLRVIQRAHRRFMRLWQLEELFVGPSVLDRVAADVTRVEATQWQGHPHPQAHPHPCPEPPSPPAPPGR